MDRTKQPPRVRLTRHIDFSKADAGCKHCGGSGVIGYKTADLGDGEGDQQIPVVCRCVSRNGGVKRDELDRIMAETKRQIDEGIFHETLAKDIWTIPANKRARAVASLMRTRIDREKTSEACGAVVKALMLLARKDEWPGLRSEALAILMQESSDPLRNEAERDFAQRALKEAQKDMN